jgi:hypothetical protein
LAATLLEPACLEAIALIEAGLRGIRTVLTRLRGGATAAELTPRTRESDPVGPAPSARADRATDAGEQPRVVGYEQPRVGGRELPTLLAGGDALPTAYGDDRVVLLARDPFCLFAYWDLAPSSWRAGERAAASDRVRILLRVSDVTRIPFTGAGAVRHRDLEIADPVGSAYVWIEAPGRSYVAEVGYVRGDGTFVTLARSNLTWAPRAERPGTDPIRWMTVRWTGRPERRHPPIGDAPSVQAAAPSARAVSSFDANARPAAAGEHADRRPPSSDVAPGRTEPAPASGRE